MLRFSGMKILRNLHCFRFVDFMKILKSSRGIQASYLLQRLGKRRLVKQMPVDV